MPMICLYLLLHRSLNLNENMKKLILLLLGCFLFSGALLACPKKKKDKLPAWVQQKIAELEKQKPHSLQSYIKEYSYQGKKVYYIPADCCDQLNPLYDEKGNVICHPSGGFSGKGDRKCLDFNPKPDEGKLIWEDVRQKKEVND